MGQRYDHLVPSESIKLAIWKKGRRILGKTPNKWRKDLAGHTIRYEDYEIISEFGWNIEYGNPESSNTDSLVPVHWKLAKRMRGYFSPLTKNEDRPSLH